MFAASDRSYAAATWARIEPALDAYAEAWVEQSQENCDATLVRGQQPIALHDARTGCLLAARRELAATTKLLAAAERSAIDRADAMVQALPRLDRCADTEQVLGGVAAPDPQIAAPVEEVRDTIATATAMQRAGKYDDAADVIEPAIARAASLGYEPLVTEGQLALGWIRDLQGREEDAEAAHAEALRLGLRTGQSELALRAATALVLVVGNDRDEPDRGLAFATTAWGLLERIGRPPQHEAELRRVLGAVYRGKKEFARAEEELRLALQVAQSDASVDPLLGAKIRHSLGLALMQGGKYEEAIEELRGSLKIRSQRSGEDHPSTATSHQNLGAVFLKKGDLEAAGKEYETAISVLTASVGPDHPSLITARGNLSSVYVVVGRTEEAIVEAREVLRLLEAKYPPDHRRVLAAKTNLASCIGAAGRREEAAKTFGEVLRALDAAGESDSLFAGTANLALAIQLTKMDRHEEALKAARAGLKITEAALGGDHPDVAEARGEVAGALVALGRFAEARPVAAAAWAVHEKGDGFPERRANTGWVYAQAIHGSGGPVAEARAIAEQARDFLDDTSDQRGWIEDWLKTLPKR